MGRPESARTFFATARIQDWVSDHYTIGTDRSFIFFATAGIQDWVAEHLTSGTDRSFIFFATARIQDWVSDHYTIGTDRSFIRGYPRIRQRATSCRRNQGGQPKRSLTPKTT